MRHLLLAACTALAGCAAEPVPYHSGNEIPQGAGLLSGEKGEFVLRFDSNKAAPQNAAEEKDYQEWREWKRRQENQKQ